MARKILGKGRYTSMFVFRVRPGDAIANSLFAREFQRQWISRRPTTSLLGPPLLSHLYGNEGLLSFSCNSLGRMLEKWIADNPFRYEPDYDVRQLPLWEIIPRFLTVNRFSWSKGLKNSDSSLFTMMLLSLSVPVTLVILVFSSFVSAQFNIFDQFFGGHHQQQQQQARGLDWYKQHYDAGMSPLVLPSNV